MRVVVDSSVLIDVLRDDPRARQLLEAHLTAGDEIWSVVVTRAEILVGMRSAERQATMRLLDQPLWLDTGVELADRAGQLARRYRRSHPGLDLADCFIAAGAEMLDAALLTQNVKHFPMFPDLAPAYA